MQVSLLAVGLLAFCDFLEVLDLMNLMLAFGTAALRLAFQGEWSVEKGSRL